MAIELGLGFLILVISTLEAESKCSIRRCNTLASYYAWEGSNLTLISQLFNTNTDAILPYNPHIPDKDSVLASTRLNVPFTCNCIQPDNDFLAHVFTYSVRPGNTYDLVANLYYSNLTSLQWLQRFNTYAEDRVPDEDATLNVTVNCSCGDTRVSTDYGLFVTYPLRPGETLDSIVADFNVSAQLILDYNPTTSNFSSGTGLVYIPAKDQSGTFRALKLSKGISNGAIGGIVSVCIGVALFTAVCVYVGIFRKKKVQPLSLQVKSEDSSSNQHGHGTQTPLNGTLESTTVVHGASTGHTSNIVDKSVEFSYKELAVATNGFGMANKIGQGGSGVVYFAELRGEKVAIKKMNMQSSKEFLAELKVLTRVQHSNLAGLIGYCVEGSLCLVYEFIENGNLREHLHGSGREPLPWLTRVQIALDSAIGLEYIHEHIVPRYIHRDIKSANILIDKNFHGKVADFGLAKLTGSGTSLQQGLVGTFGYMPPEYVHNGGGSAKVDVYAFGVVLYELISGKEAIVKDKGFSSEFKGLVALFEDVLNNPDPENELHKLVDSRLGDNYQFDSICKMAQLAKACTQQDPQQRPSMRFVVVALMTLSSSTENWDVGLYSNQAFMNLMSGR